MTTNKNDANREAVLSAVASLRAALENESNTALTGRALEQCHRLERAIAQFHAEGLRFAAFTLLRTVQNTGTTFTDAVRSATHDLKAALERAGYPH